MGMRYYRKKLAALLFEKKKKKPDPETEQFRQVLNDGIDSLAAAIADDPKFKNFGDIQANAGVSAPPTPSNQNTAEKYVADALRDRLSRFSNGRPRRVLGAKVTRVNSISDIHITPIGEKEPVVRVEVKFSKKSITRIRSGSTLLSAHDYIVFVDKNGIRWATSKDLMDFAKSRKSVAGMHNYSAQDILDGTTDIEFGDSEEGPFLGAVDMTKGEYEYITKLIRSRIAKARGDTDKADASYTMPFTIDGSKVRVDLKFESLFRKYILNLLNEDKD
jgi:hypothetical protein